MPRHDVSVSLRQMRDHAREAMTIAAGRTRADLDADRLLNLGLVHLLEIVGEAANRIPPADRSGFPEIPWPQLIGLRNRLIHAYDQVDFDILWQIVGVDLPPLVALLDTIITE